MRTAKSYEIPKRLVWEAYKRVKANGGAAGVDEQSLLEFEGALGNNLYRIWNRMSSGSYFPPPVKAVAIPKKSGGGGTYRFGSDCPDGGKARAGAATRTALSRGLIWLPAGQVGTPGDRGHPQTMLVPRLGAGVRHPGFVRQHRPWVSDEDCKWVLLYIERWLTAPMQNEDGTLSRRDRGTPQGGVISPLLANLFLHYAFDRWMTANFPKVPFCRYADDGLIHCRSLEQAQYLKQRLADRLKECGLELHPDKTKVVYCKGVHRQQEYETIQFDFLGYTFRPRRSKDRYGRVFVNFTPAISRSAMKALRQEIRGWRLQLKSDKSIEDLSRMFAPVIRGWINYYCRFYPSAFKPVADRLNLALTRWAMRKFRKLRGHQRRARHWIGRVANRQRGLFPHWRAGFVTSTGTMGAG